MKKLIAIAAAVAMAAIMAAVPAFAGTNGGSGVPAMKTSYGYSDIEYTTGTNSWVTDPQATMTTTIHTSNGKNAGLVISYTGEADLITDVQLKGSGSSTSWAGIYVRVLVDGKTDGVLPDETSVASNIATDPGGVALNYRLVTLSGTLWEPGTSLLFAGLPTQYIDLYEHTRSANGFNFIVPNIGVGTHTITVQYYVDTGAEGIPANSNAGAIIGKRTLIVEQDNLN